MTNTTKTRIYRSGSRTFIYLQKPLVDDSSFPFQAGDEVNVTIEGKKLVITKAKK